MSNIKPVNHAITIQDCEHGTAMKPSVVYADALTCLGSGKDLWRSLLAGRSGLRRADDAFPNLGIEQGGYVGVLPDIWGDHRLPQIFETSFNTIIPEIFFESDMVIGACSLGDLTGPEAGNPRTALSHQLKNHWPHRKPRPPMSLISSACSSGTDALIMASEVVKAGLADVVGVLAFDSLEVGKLIQHIALGTQSRDRARPFDAGRSGTSFGEGCALAIITNDRGKVRLGLKPLALVAGFGMSSDAYDIAAPFPTGKYAARAISEAIVGTEKKAIGYINAHGSGTKLNDHAECAAFGISLGEHAQHINISSTKGALGHTLGATGLIESIVVINSLQSGTYPPTACLQNLDPLISLKVIKEAKVKDDAHQYALSVTFGFGGVNSAILLEAV